MRTISVRFISELRRQLPVALVTYIVHLRDSILKYLSVSMVEQYGRPFTSATTTTATADTLGQMETNSIGYVLVVVAAVLGGVALLLTIIYAYIYCAKIKPRHRSLATDRINYFDREACIQYGSPPDKDQTDRAPIKAHPFFVISSASRAKANSGEATQHASTSNKPY